MKASKKRGFLTRKDAQVGKLCAAASQRATWCAWSAGRHGKRRAADSFQSGGASRLSACAMVPKGPLKARQMMETLFCYGPGLGFRV